MSKPMLKITDTLSIDDGELEERFIRSSGPGGQNVNKVATAVELRFDVRRSPSLDNAVAIRLMKMAGKRVNDEGVLVIRADRFRTQDRNRQDARDRLAEMVRAATVVDKPRVKTKPSRSVKARRTDAKKARSTVKSMRRVRPDAD
jgi:ribosome-associated protein